MSQLPALKEMVIFGIFKDPGRHWFSDFFKRNENKIKMKKEVKLEHSTKQGFTETVRSGWFQKVKDLLDRNDLHFRPNGARMDRLTLCIDAQILDGYQN